MYRDDPPALELRGLTKRYDDGTLALENFDLEIPAGAFFGLLGPNGAGKTTLISAVCNLIRVSEGDVLVFGEPADTLLARSWIGLAEQDINLDRFLTVRETLAYHGGYFGMRRDEAEERADEMIEIFGLQGKRDTRAPKLSGGQRRRLLLARALMHRPRLVILDEPTAGVDFELRTELWRYIQRLHAEGTTILLTTHYLEEAEHLCEEIALIRDGRLLARDSADGLRELFGVERLQDVYVKAMAVPWPRTRSMTGMLWLCRRETLRVSKLWTQTVLAPVVSSLLFILVFGLSLGGRIKQVGDVDYEVFIVPGLITMAMVQAAYANNASTIFQARFDRYINDVLSAPMRPWQMTLGYTVGGLFRALAIGGSLLVLAVLLVGVPVERPFALVAAVALGLRAVRLARPRGRHLRRDLGPHHLHREHRDPPAGLRRRRLLLRRRAAGALARALARQSGLLPRERGALRLPRRVRRVRLALASASPPRSRCPPTPGPSTCSRPGRS